jgi:multiple sugar transport system ATP-binding protein
VSVVVKITLKGVCKYFKKTKAVDNLGLEIADGEFLVLLGPSGCGKTTTLRVIAGLEKATAGEIYFDDQLVNDVEPRERKVAMVFQDYALYPHMSVRDNITLCLKAMKVPKSEIEKRLQETAGLLQLSELLKRKPGELSGGQKQRVALARAVIRNPSVYLLDEPMSNLDAMLRIKMRGELKKLHEKLKTTTVYVTHDQAEAMVLADRIVVMKDGLLHQISKPLEIYDHPVNKFVASFVGIPVMNFIECSVSEKKGESFLVNDDFEFKIPNSILRQAKDQLPSSEVVFGIRPEHIIVAKDPFKDALVGKVWLFQHMGDTGYLSVEIGSNIITAKVDPWQFDMAEGEKVYVGFNERFIHIFDKTTEKTIV